MSFVFFSNLSQEGFVRKQACDSLGCEIQTPNSFQNPNFFLQFYHTNSKFPLVLCLYISKYEDIGDKYLDIEILEGIYCYQKQSAPPYNENPIKQ